MYNNTAEQMKATPDFDSIKAKHKATWEDGNYANFAKYMQAGAVDVLDKWNIPAGQRLLDVGCGAGQTAIPAAKLGIDVTGIDLAENLIQHARHKATEANLKAQFDVGDAEALPYENESFDVVISMFGAMFAPRPDQVVSEFVRVLKPGGRLLMANWMPGSMPAQMFKTVAAITPPPEGTVPPVLWGDESTVSQRLKDDFTDIKLTANCYPQWNYPFDTDGVVDLFRRYFGPVKCAFEACNAKAQTELHETLRTIYANNSSIENGILTITGGNYLEIDATRR